MTSLLSSVRKVNWWIVFLRLLAELADLERVIVGAVDALTGTAMGKLWTWLGTKCVLAPPAVCCG